MRNPNPKIPSEVAQDALNRLPDILKARHNLDILEYQTIKAAYEAGATWIAIGHHLGLSDKSARQRFTRLGWGTEEARRAMGVNDD